MFHLLFIAKIEMKNFPLKNISNHLFTIVKSAIQLMHFIRFSFICRKKHIQRSCSVIYKIELHQSGLTSRFILAGDLFENNVKKHKYLWRSLALSSVI